MREGWISVLRCPITHAPYDLDATRDDDGEIVEGFLVALGGREPRPIVAGLAVLPRDLRAHLRDFGNVYERMPVADSRVFRFVRGRLGRRVWDQVPFAELVAHYGDLLPPDGPAPPPPMAPDDLALQRLLAGQEPTPQPGLVVGCGVGRGAFVLRAHAAAVLGVDRSVARVRRGRNIAETTARFFLPAAGAATDRQDAPLDLDRLARRGVDFAVADPDALPLADGCLGVVVSRLGDGLGPFADPDARHAEATRVLAPDGLLVLEESGEEAPVVPGWRRVGAQPPFAAWRRV